jgi:hypothetical protein
MVVGLSAGACGGAHNKTNPLESPLGEIQASGTPQTVVRITEESNNDWIKDIAIVDNDLYVAVAWHGIYRLPKYGGGITAIDESGNATEYYELASGDGAVFWEAASFDNNDFPTTFLRRVATGDAAVSTIHRAVIGGLDDSRGKNLQVDGSIIYVTEIENGTDTGAIRRIPITGGAELSSIMPFTAFVPGYHSPTDPPRVWIARNGGVFYADCPLDSGSCAVQRVTGDGTQTIVTFPGKEAYVRAVDETSIYVTNPIVVTGTPPSVTTPLLKIDQEAGAITELTPDCGGGDLMLDGGQELFYLSYAGGAITIDAVSKQGGAPRTVANVSDTHQSIWRMAQDDTYLFALTVQNDTNLQTQVVAIPKGTPAQP